jgi:serine/threonine protein kinase
MLMNYHSDVDVRVTDFGLAKKGTHCKTFCGTPAYYAPEVLSRQNTLAGAGMYGAEADCWSIGVIAYVVLSGTPAFPSQMLNESISTGEFVPMTSKKWAACSEASKAFVKALLVVSPSERLTAAQAKQHAWLSMGSHSNQPSVAASKLSKVPMAPPKAKRGILCDGNLPSSSVIEGVSSSSKVPKSE